MFVVLHVLNGTSLETSLGERYIQDNELAALFNNTGREIDPKFAQEKQKKRTKKDFQSILSDHDSFQDAQVWNLHNKSKRSAKCTNWQCKKVLKIGMECFIVSGAL